MTTEDAAGAANAGLDSPCFAVIQTRDDGEVRWPWRTISAAVEKGGGLGCVAEWQRTLLLLPWKGRETQGRLLGLGLLLILV